MSLFDQLVDQAIGNQPDLANLRVVVEKELLHHDIMLVLSETGLLEKLCFIGGTCLRACYGSNRLSEDLDFTGGADFNRDGFAQLRAILIERLQTKYSLQVDVSEPSKESGNVDTWKLRVQTRPDARNLPAQRIHIDICAIPSYMSTPRVLLNPYGVNMGTQGLILNAEALEEIYVDKILAFVLRQGRIKSRDLWDLLWLKQQKIEPALQLLPDKLNDHRVQTRDFLEKAAQRSATLINDLQVKADFRSEMQRFLPIQLVEQTVNDDRFWAYLIDEVPGLIRRAQNSLGPEKDSRHFMM
ncbi:Predicted nucleotidyltransferase component of viral defense system [Ectopseudomonas chengduensis]|uniref:Predicted nucleotidyltransferase component of viral defense system n=1 Tax=Ectopseudomonas chengduensis TaxID=489632 RepID=A0A1G6IB62_9GAMM|nr:nucleotidyl transferase AbiEii/AbiGii toxin family protein [Pseudomonas chengduensis]MBP3059716.1 nucleotidyl transferase AbiEii/AbiGii toxin family protein [Pseudomonas chengduensis]NNB73268.1 nucleotidyl transferase AbiEii/AbiGii toxin family protein [Pseudomonas chengduensis]SDC03255.1 Predicted nucleotidyltransferase component of viral defense system [Pseudomonas chengduensis]